MHAHEVSLKLRRIALLGAGVFALACGGASGAVATATGPAADSPTHTLRPVGIPGPDAGTSDAGTSDAGIFIPDAGTSDAGTFIPDAGTFASDAGTDGGTAGLAAGGAHGPLDEGAEISIHTTLGLPDESTPSADDPDHYLSVKPQYVEGYNADYRESNWVAWELDASWIGDTARTDDFRQDDTFPTSLTQPANSDYKYSGYDRGHLCNAKDRSDDVADMSSTFYLTNMVPQAPHSNRGPWLRLETYERDLAEEGKYLFIYAGPIFDSPPETIGDDHVAVPIATWKVIAVLDAPHATAASVTTSTRVIAVIIPNDDSRVAQSDDWTLYRTSVDDVESRTGLDLLSDVDTSVQRVIEAEVDPGEAVPGSGPGT